MNEKLFNAELIAYQQQELKEMLKELTSSVNSRLASIEARVVAAEKFQSTLEGERKALASSEGSGLPGWAKGLAAIGTIIATAIAGVVAAGGHP